MPTTTTASKPAQAEPASDIYSALFEAKPYFAALVKDADNPYFKSKYTSFSAILQAVEGPLRDVNCLITSCFDTEDNGRVTVLTTIRHIPSGTFVFSSFPVADCSSPQKIGSAGTYGLRYNLKHLLVLAEEADVTDNDGGAPFPPLGQSSPPSPGYPAQLTQPPYATPDGYI